MKKLPLFAAILTTTIAPAFGSPLPPAPAPAPALANPAILFRTTAINISRPDEPGARPDNPPDRLANFGVTHAVDRLWETPTTAGVRSRKMAPPPPRRPALSLYSDYSYINSDDSRLLGSDTRTHSVTIGGDIVLGGDWLLGMNYAFSAGSSSRDIFGSSDDTDANFLSLYAAKSFWRFLSVGVVGGWGRTEHDISTVAGDIGARTDTWSVSPFLAATYAVGPVTTSLTTMYSWENDRTRSAFATLDDHTGKFSVALRTTYAATERLRLQASAKFTTIPEGLNSTPGLPESRSWATFGARVSYFVMAPLEIYAGYAYDAFNSNLQTHTVNGGLRYNF